MGGFCYVFHLSYHIFHPPKLNATSMTQKNNLFAKNFLYYPIRLSGDHLGSKNSN